MKKLGFHTGNLILVIGFCLISYSGYSQNIKLSRRDQKEAKKAQNYAMFQLLDTLLDSKAFVLEADFLEDQYGNRVNVTSVLNFIRVDSDKAVLQTGSNIYLGYNGVGGITAEGNVNNWEVNKNVKNLSYFLRFSVSTNIGFYDVSMFVTSGNYARATITGLTPGQLIYTGHLKTLFESSVFKGRNTI